LKVSVFIATSIDGFIARKNGDIDWLSGSDSENSGEDYGYQEFIDTVDVLVMGRNSYEKVLSFGEWPYASKKVVVLSTKNLKAPDNLDANIEFKSCSPTDLIAELGAIGAEHLYIDGGRTIQGFLKEGLIQELVITRIPVLLGEGISLFGPIDGDIKLQHVETKQFENGYVQSRYKAGGIDA
jgi:dihydrofolate reductase